jgi:hypothetical protein
VQADPQAYANIKQRLRPLLRTVAMTFPQATVELCPLKWPTRSRIKWHF